MCPTFFMNHFDSKAERTKAFHVCYQGGPFTIWTVCVGYFFGRIGGATTFASAKVKNAIGRIGIFKTGFLKHDPLYIESLSGYIFGMNKKQMSYLPWPLSDTHKVLRSQGCKWAGCFRASFGVKYCTPCASFTDQEYRTYPKIAPYSLRLETGIFLI